MNECKKLIKKQMLNVFETNKDLILNAWFKRLIENEKDIKEFDIVANIFRCILDNYINYLKIEDRDVYMKFIKEIVQKIDVANISYNDLIVYLLYFQESYISVLLKNFKNKDVEKYIILSNRMHNKIIIDIQNEYLNINDSTLIAMLKLSELRDDTTEHHVERTQEYAVLLSKALNLNDNFVKHMSKASLLHDIGKIAIRDEVLLKPGKLTEAEYEEIKKHTIIGAKTISKVISVNEYANDYLYMAIDIALVDAYDVITSERPYKKAFSHEEAVRRIKLDCGKHFDPGIVNVFLKIQDKFKIINDKYKLG